MEQRDIIKDQIEQLGRVIGKIITGFLGLKSAGKVSQGIEATNQQFKEAVSIDIALLLVLDKKALKEYVSSKNLTSDHLFQIADYITEIGDHQSDSAAKTGAFSSAINLYELANGMSDSFDLERNFKERSIIQKLNNLE